MRRRHARLLASAAALCCIGFTAAAQQPEIRADILGPAPNALSSGIGMVVPFGYYVRGSADVSYGVRDVGGANRAEWRGDLLVRFLFDPFREQRIALSFGGGLSIRRRTYIALIADLEGPAFLGVVPALQAGVSGGWRAGLLLRRAMMGRR